MKVLSPMLHGYIDFLTVVIFAVAPTVFGFDGLPAYIAYALAVIHLVLTLTTAFPKGVVGVVPFAVHGLIEIVVAIVLVILPFVFGWTDAPRNFFIGIGIVIFLVWLLSDYRKTSAVKT